MVAFVPLLFAVGAIGVMLGVIAGTVICCVAFSLVECLLVLPAHLGHRVARMPFGEFGMILLVVMVIAAFVVAPDVRFAAALAVVAVAVVWASHLAGFLGRLTSQFGRAQVRFERGSTADREGVSTVRRGGTPEPGAHARVRVCRARHGIIYGGHVP